MNTTTTTEEENKLPDSLQWIEKTTEFLDDKFRIPGTNFRFGLDALIGIIPGVGDIVSYGLSASMMIAIVWHGINLSTLFKMLWNIILDYLVGLIPVLGDFFDVAYKANRKNLNLLQDYYKSDHYTPSHKYTIWVVTLALLLSIGFAIGFGAYFLLSTLGGLLNTLIMGS